MATIKIKRKKAPLGAAIPIITTALSTMGDIFSSSAAAEAQKQQLLEAKERERHNQALNKLQASQQTFNSYASTLNQVGDIYRDFANGGYIDNIKGGKLVNIGGGKLGVIGKTHDDGGVKMDVNLGSKKLPIELQGNGDKRIGEIIYKNKVFSNELPLYAFGGKTPASIIKRRPNDNQLADYIFALQENEKDVLGLNDDGSRKSVRNTPPVGRMSAPYGMSFSKYITDPFNLGWNGYRYNNGRTIGGTVNMGINTGSRSYNPNVDRTIGGTVNMGINTTARQQVADAMSNVHSLYQKVPTYKTPTYKTSKWDKFNDWLGIRSKPIDYVNLAAGIGGALASRFVHNSNYNKISDLYANYRKQLEGSRYNRSSYIDADTTATDWAKHAALSRTSQNALRLAGQNTSSASNLLDRSNEILSNALVEHNKIFDENRKENLERRFQNTANRNQFNLQQDANAADYEMKKLSALGELTAQQAGFEDSRINDNRQMWRDITSAITNFGQVGMDRMQDQRLFTNNMLMNLMNIKDDKIFDRIEEYFPGMLDALRRSPYSIANTRGYIS